jgi:hypothetical protein
MKKIKIPWFRKIMNLTMNLLIIKIIILIIKFRIKKIKIKNLISKMILLTLDTKKYWL